MSIPFSRSTRSLQADSYRPTLIGLIISTTLLSLWTAWFLFAQIPVTEMSQSILSIERNVVTATFPRSVGERIKPRQKATIHVGQDSQQIIPAEVININFRTSTGQVEVEFFALEPLPINSSGGQIINDVEVVVSSISPATLVIEAAQQLSQ